jgi:hypothetical protein
VRVTNTGGQSIAGPMIIAFRPPEGVTLSSAAGYTCAVWPHGAPYLSLPVGTALAAGQHVDVVLRFDNPDDSPIVLMGQKVYAGSGFR